MRWTVSCACIFQSFRNELIYAKSYWSLNYVVLQVTRLPLFFVCQFRWMNLSGLAVNGGMRGCLCLSHHHPVTAWTRFQFWSPIKHTSVWNPAPGWYSEISDGTGHTECKYWHLVCGPGVKHPADCLRWNLRGSAVLRWWWSSSCHVTVRAYRSFLHTHTHTHSLHFLFHLFIFT